MLKNQVQRLRYIKEINELSKTWGNKSINIRVTDDVITLVSRLPVELLKRYFDHVCEKHVSPKNVIMFYGSKEGSWDFPVPRRPRLINHDAITKDMKQVLDDVKVFVQSDPSNNSDIYKHRPYRRGYLLKGPSGTGKTSIVEYVAAIYGRSVYRVTLNAKHMTDETLQNLFCTVNPYSIIVIDEFEKQLGRNKYLSPGALLSAIDGPERLSHGTIIFLTANSRVEFPNCDGFYKNLIRPGRIDKCYTLNIKSD